MSFPVILYKNLFRNTGAVLTSSGTDTGYTPANVANHRSFQGWQGNVLTSPQWLQVDVGGGGDDADSLLIVNGNLVLVNGATVKIYADTVDPPTTVVQAGYNPGSDQVSYKAFTAPGAKRYWRVEFTDPSPPFAAKPFVGELMLGKKLTMPEFVAPDMDPYGHDVIATDSKSAGGHFLGVTLQGIARRGVLHFGGGIGVDRATFTSDLTYFLQNHYRKCLPWGFVLNTDDTDFARPWWLKKPADARTPTMPVGNSYARFTFDLPYEEAMMEPVGP